MAKLQELISSTTGIPAPPSEEVIQEIIQEAQRALYEDQWQTCAVCDEEKPSVPLPGEDKLFRKLLPSELPSRAYIVLLPGADHGYPEELLAQCHVAGLFSDTTERALVKPLLLSPRGIVTDGAANALEHAARSNRLNVCTSCFTSLKVAQNAKPPPLAIANGFVIGIVL